MKYVNAKNILKGLISVTGLNKKRITARVILSLIISFISSVCTQAIETHACFGWDNTERFKWLLIFAGTFAVVFIFATLSDFVLSNIKNDTHKKFWENEKLKFILPAFLFVCWLPYLIVYMPGLLNYDTINQVNDFFDGVSSVPFGFVGGQEEVTVLLNAHHPVFVTVIFGLFIKLGMLFGSVSYGITIYIVAQMILAAVVMGYIIRNLDRISGRKPVLKTALAVFFALCPVIPFYVCIMLKNSLHSILALLYIFYYLEMAMDDRELTGKEKVLFIVLSVLLALTQNTGVYLVVLSAIPLVIKKSSNRPAVLGGAVAAFLLMVIILPNIIYPALNIFPGGKQEMLGTFFQQTARYARDYPEDLTAEDVEVISEVLDYDELINNYTFDTSDNIKATYNLHATGKELSAYFGMWLKHGLKHPDSYFRAILPICGNFFAMGIRIGIFDHIPTQEGVFEGVNQARSEGLYTAVSDTYYYFSDFPIIGIIFNNALYALLIPFYCIYVNMTGSRKKNLTYSVPFIVNILFLIMSPMGYARYALTLIFASPLLLCKTAMGMGDIG